MFNKTYTFSLYHKYKFGHPLSIQASYTTSGTVCNITFCIRERERERERETDRRTYRHSLGIHVYADIESNRERDTQIYTHTDRERYMHTDRQKA